jgi:hypothetical protein
MSLEQFVVVVRPQSVLALFMLLFTFSIIPNPIMYGLLMSASLAVDAEFSSFLK